MVAHLEGSGQGTKQSSSHGGLLPYHRPRCGADLGAAGRLLDKCVRSVAAESQEMCEPARVVMIVGVLERNKGVRPLCFKVAHGVFSLIRLPVSPQNSSCLEKTKFFEERNPAAILRGVLLSRTRENNFSTVELRWLAH